MLHCTFETLEVSRHIEMGVSLQHLEELQPSSST